MHKFVLFHLIECIPYDLPHIIYLYVLCITKFMGGLEDIYYTSLVNKILWEQGVYQVFNGLDEASRNKIMVKGSMIAKQQNLGPLNIKSIRLAMNIGQREVPQVNKEEIAKKRKKGIKIMLPIDNDALSQFGIATKINKIMKEQAKNK